MNDNLAGAFAEAWIKAWNDHDLEMILSHYAENIEFHSPLIISLKFNETGIITGKYALEKYFTIGLSRFPALRFQLHQYFYGSNSVVLYYTSVNEIPAAEFFELDGQGKAVKVFCHYAAT